MPQRRHVEYPVDCTIDDGFSSHVQRCIEKYRHTATPPNEWRERLAGSTHVDGTARLLVLEREMASRLYSLLVDVLVLGP
jgi:predicted NodU family carbamoyl transferase